MILQDNHLHTNFSDGLNSIEEMAMEAIRLSFDKITFTDHVRHDSEWIREYVEEIHRVQKLYKEKLIIGIGVETKIIDHMGRLDCPEWVLKYKEIEKVAAIHRIPVGDGNYFSRSQIGTYREKCIECYINTIKGIKDNKNISRIAHPFSLFEELDISTNDKRCWQRIFNALEDSDVKVEYNVKYDNERIPYELWQSLKNKIVFGSDSHSVEELIFNSNKLRKIELDIR